MSLAQRLSWKAPWVQAGSQRGDIFLVLGQSLIPGAPSCWAWLCPGRSGLQSWIILLCGLGQAARPLGHLRARQGSLSS